MNIVVHYESKSHGKRRYLTGFDLKSGKPTFSYEEKDAIKVPEQWIVPAVRTVFSSGYYNQVMIDYEDGTVKDKLFSEWIKDQFPEDKEVDDEDEEENED